MDKSIYTREYSTLLRLLRRAREDAGITQVALAELLHQTQSFVSKIEKGDRRLDVIQLRTILKAFGVSFTDFICQLEEAISADETASD